VRPRGHSRRRATDSHLAAALRRSAIEFEGDSPAQLGGPARGTSGDPRRRELWFLDRTQWWRWRHQLLWRFGSFDPHDTTSVCAYAVMGLPATTRDVFLLHRVAGLSYPAIASHLALDPQTVEAHVSAALLELGQTLNLVSASRPSRSKAAEVAV